MQFLTHGGHSLIMDDSVEEPQGVPEWERSTKSFDFGCNDTFKGKIKIISATGHLIEMSDVESSSQLRGEENYIRLKTASGNLLELNDHTVGPDSASGAGDEGCDPSNLAGEKRGLTVRTTSNHTFEMIDEQNEQSSPCRREGGTPTNKAKQAFVRTRTGYGLEILMRDDFNQEDSESQHIQIFAPQAHECGPHIMRFQVGDPGYVFLRVGGNYICSTCLDHYTIVGDKEENPSNKLTIVSDNYIEQTENFYYNGADIHLLNAKQIILLLAGEDCEDDEGNLGGCPAPVLCLTSKGIVISDRVFASASPDASCASIFQLMPFHQCESE